MLAGRLMSLVSFTFSMYALIDGSQSSSQGDCRG